MEKFIVIVNHKYAVSIEAESNGGAEHKILDGIYYGIGSCLAFSLKEIKTKFFAEIMSVCDTISYDELYRKTENIRKNYAEIKDLQEKIQRHEDHMQTIQNEINKYTNQIIAIKARDNFESIETFVI